MSVRKVWLAADMQNASEYTAETTQDALQPIGEVKQDVDGVVLDTSSLNEGLAQAVRSMALCNVAT